MDLEENKVNWTGDDNEDYELNTTTITTTTNTSRSPTTSVFQFSRISNSLYNSTELYAQYRPEVGVRTAGILGSILFFIVFYLLWRNRCRCSSSSSGSQSGEISDELLKMIKQQQQKLDPSMTQQQQHQQQQLLPPRDKSYDSRQATEAWIIEHRKIWNHRHRQSSSRAIHDHVDKKKTKSSRSKVDEMERQSVTMRSKLTSRSRGHLNTSQQSRLLLETMLNKFRIGGGDHRLSGSASAALQMKGYRINRRGLHHNNHHSWSSLKLPRSAVMLESSGGVDTQLLINYARIDAIDASVINFNKITGGIIPTSYPANNNLPPLQHSSFSHHEDMTTNRQHDPDITIASVVDLGVDLDPRLAATTEYNNSSSLLLLQQRHFISHMLTSLMHRRRSSWPRCRSDHLQWASFARDVRLFYQNSHHVYSVNETADS